MKLSNHQEKTMRWWPNDDEWIPDYKLPIHTRIGPLLRKGLIEAKYEYDDELQLPCAARYRLTGKGFETKKEIEK